MGFLQVKKKYTLKPNNYFQLPKKNLKGYHVHIYTPKHA